MSFPRYPKYRDSGVSWLGAIPYHWDVSRLKSLFSLMSRLPDETDEIVTVFRDGEVTLRNNRRVDGFTNAVQEHGYQRIHKGDLVIHTMDAFAGAIGVSDSDGKSTPVYLVCTPKSSAVKSSYYGRLMRHMALTGYISSLSKGIRERSTEFRWNEAANTFLAVPPLAEQVQIEAFLARETEKISGLMDEQGRLIELLKEKRQVVISRAITQGLDSGAPMTPSGVGWLRDVPNHWETTRLKRVTSLIVDCPHETPIYSEVGERLVIRTADLDEGVIDDSQMFRVSEEEYVTRIRRAPLLYRDIVYGREGERWGHAALIPESGRFCLGQRMMQFRAADDTDPEFLMWALNAEVTYLQGELDTVGATTPHVNVSTIRNYHLTHPPIEEQREIGITLSRQTKRFDMLIGEAERAIRLLQERRAALIAAAVTGKIDVRGLVDEEAG